MGYYRTLHSREIETLRSNAFMWGYIIGGSMASGFVVFLRHFGVL